MALTLERDQVETDERRIAWLIREGERAEDAERERRRRAEGDMQR